MSRVDYKKIVTSDPLIRDGEPCIRGLPITVDEILSRVGDMTSFGQILLEYPQLTREDIIACVRFASDQPLGKFFGAMVTMSPDKST
jgi:uncharacterized protein (DUF433 family)